MNRYSVLITGGFGFIGVNLAKQLRACDNVDRISLLDIGNARSPFKGLIPTSQVMHIVADIRNRKAMFNAVTGHDVIYHLAAETHVQHSIANPVKFVETNVLGTLSVLEAARKTGARLIYASTSEVYGDAKFEPMTELHPLDAQSPYAASKLAADRLVGAYTHTYGLSTSIVRMFNVYGPGQYYEKLIPMFICSMLSNKPLPIQGDGSDSRDWTFVADTCRRLVAMLPRSAPALLNLGSGITKSVADIAGMAEALIKPTHPLAQHLPSRPGRVSRQRADGEAVASKVGAIQTSFEDGLRLTVDWYREHTNLWIDAFARDRDRILSQMM